MKDNHTTPFTRRQQIQDMAVTGLMTAVLCIAAPFSIPIPVSPVPISLTNFIIFIAIYVLGIKNGTLSVLIYLILGAAGLPVFSAFSGGPGKLAGPTGGYLIGFLFLALIQGLFLKSFPERKAAPVIGMILGMAVCYAFGTAWLAWQMNQGFAAALGIGVLPYLPGDAVKIIAAAASGPKLRAAVIKAKKQ